MHPAPAPIFPARAASRRATSASCSSPLIPGILDDVVFDHIITKVSWKCFFVLPAINTRWREEFRSGRVYEYRRSTGTDQQLVAVIHSSDRLEFVLSLVTLSDKNEWLHLPPIPGVPGGVPRGCGLAFLEGILYIIGGYDVSGPCLSTFHCRKTVYELDVAAGRGAWRTGVPMKMEKGDFFCKVEEGRIHITQINTFWPVPRWEFDIYHPVSKCWTHRWVHRQPNEVIPDPTRVMQEIRLRGKILVRNTMARVNGSLYSVSAEGVSVRDNLSGKWHLHSLSFRDYVRSLGPDDDIQCWDVVPLDGELVVTVSWPRRSLDNYGQRWYNKPSDFIFALVKSKGLGSGEQRVTWNKIQFPDPDPFGWWRSFPNEVCNEKNGSFPVFDGCFLPQVYPCKL